jgi:signal transduction histidine kinase
MRGLLGVLRQDGTDALPQPGLDDLEDLVDGVRGSGLRVTVEASGAPPRELSRTWQLTAYRIVQESLTNVLKHAGEGVRAGVAAALPALRAGRVPPVAAMAQG